MQTPSPRLITAQEAAKILGIPYTSLRDLVFRGRIPVVRLSRRWRFDRRDLDTLVEQHKERVAQ